MANLQVLLWFRSNSHRQEDIQVFAFRRYSTVEPPKHLIVKRMTAILMLLILNLGWLKMELKWSLHLYEASNLTKFLVNLDLMLCFVKIKGLNILKAFLLFLVYFRLSNR